MEDMEDQLVTLNTAAGALVAARSITWCASVAGGKPHVLLQTGADADVHAAAAELGVEAKLVESRTTDGTFEYLVATKELELLNVRIMGPHHRLVRDAA